MTPDELPAGPSFSDFFSAAWGYKPFAWQQELAESVADSQFGWPALLDVPTGMGKTASLDVFVWHLATEASRAPQDRTAPTRAAFVIDRRLVVDSAFHRMRTLTRTLRDSTDPAVVSVATRLRSIGGSGFPLVVQRMRGGLTWEANWVRRPDQPAIVCGTVDQIGSRLLSRGYGGSRSRMPIDAGLLGVDCLLLLDEAHLSAAMVSTVRGVSLLEQRSPSAMLPTKSGRIVRLTATPSENREREVVLRVSSDSPDAIDGTAVARLTALKRTVLVQVAKPTEVAVQMAEIAPAMVGGEDRVVLVVANTVKTARAVFDLVRAASKTDAYLLIGRCRQLERQHNEGQWMERALAGRMRSKDDRPLIVVATQTVEVGVDLDVDVLVTEIAAADALVQRFGRVDRLGHRAETTSVIVGCPAKAGDDPVYGAAAKATWDLLAGSAQPLDLQKHKKGGLREQIEAASWFDAGSLAFREILDAVPDRRPLLATVSPAPVVIPQTLSCWIRTSPIPDPDEAVGPYLHGVDRDDPTVSVLWRAANSASDLRESIERFPLRGDELVEIPFRVFMGFARTDPESSDVLSDLEGRSTPEEDEEQDRRRPRIDPLTWLIVRSRTETIDGEVDSRGRANARPGDILVLASNVGGHDAHGWSGRRTDGVVPDVADLVERSKLRLRLSEAVLITLGVATPSVRATLRSFNRLAPDSEVGDRVAELLRAFMEASGAVETHLRSPALASFDTLVGHLLGQESWAAKTEYAGEAIVLCIPIKDDEDEDEMLKGVALVARLPATTPDEDPNDKPIAIDVDDDGEGSSLLGAPVRSAELGLLRHSTDVAQRAAEFATHAGLGTSLIATLRFAGFLHDLGKADARFQAMLRRGNIAAARAAAGQFTELLAKSNMDRGDIDAARAASRASGWPGLRHEAISLALAKTWPSDRLPSGVDLDLTLHLVATHHGYGRPWFPADRDDRNPEKIRIDLENELFPPELGITGDVTVEAESSDGIMAFDQPDRLDRLRRKYGFWGLSYLEALLRLADVSISEELTNLLEAEGNHG